MGAVLVGLRLRHTHTAKSTYKVLVWLAAPLSLWWFSPLRRETAVLGVHSWCLILNKLLTASVAGFTAGLKAVLAHGGGALCQQTAVLAGRTVHESSLGS